MTSIRYQSVSRFYVAGDDCINMAWENIILIERTMAAIFSDGQFSVAKQ